MNPAVKGIAIGSARLSMLVAAIAVISTPWVAGWALSTSVIWDASFVALVYAVNLSLSRTAARWDIRKQVPQGEQVRIVVAVRRRVGKLPFPLLSDEFALALTDQRLLIQSRSTFTGRPRGALHLAEQVTLRQGKVLSIETESGVSIDALVQVAHRRDIAHWIGRRQDL
ncbi:hypothetical protein [Streptomyces spectabilis]|uniref:Uncharacterized protein n=1 Tax=Streptomyces spectabilis TaxID=68270 RepID=A0A7W8ARJ2_STRST|nr:hypothetical protein [Streptomyces spectabilis]MBB5103232.1 hypothetical protein [Streptomyces spectabilis]MCI3902425.1 hypothetical protein [Streptomyces spectabilis]GGV13951.1 hypothetical protein GCM10010245_24320 [Streptomyces spectabilis]